MFVAKRLLGFVPQLILLSFVTFALPSAIPTDAVHAVAGDGATKQQLAEKRKELGLDQPLLVRYGNWLGDAVQGDLGQSWTTKQKVTDAISDRLPATLSLVVVALVLGLVLGVPLGLVAGLKPGGVADRGLRVFAAISTAVPPFVLGLLLVVFLAVGHTWFPATGYVPLEDGFGPWFEHLILPGIALGCIPGAVLGRQTRTAMVNVLEQDYIRTARAKGLTTVSVVAKHAAKNAAEPVVTTVGILGSRLISGALAVEFAFAIPGIGRLAYDAVTTGDAPVLAGVVLVAGLIVAIVNLLVDLSYGYFSPRTRSV